MDIDFIKSDDYFSTFTVLVESGNKYLQTKTFILVAQALKDDLNAV